MWSQLSVHCSGDHSLLTNSVQMPKILATPLLLLKDAEKFTDLVSLGREVESHWDFVLALEPVARNFRPWKLWTRWWYTQIHSNSRNWCLVCLRLNYLHRVKISWNYTSPAACPMMIYYSQTRPLKGPKGLLLFLPQIHAQAQATRQGRQMRRQDLQ